MHYNIKIKSKNSEFSLDSANKDIMQREADLYFAHIFNASEDFIANIKTIEFDKTTTKSIEELEQLSNARKEVVNSDAQQQEKEPNEINNQLIKEYINSLIKQQKAQEENTVENKTPIQSTIPTPTDAPVEIQNQQITPQSIIAQSNIRTINIAPAPTQMPVQQGVSFTEYVHNEIQEQKSKVIDTITFSSSAPTQMQTSIPTPIPTQVPTQTPTQIPTQAFTSANNINIAQNEQPTLNISQNIQSQNVVQPIVEETFVNQTLIQNAEQHKELQNNIVETISISDIEITLASEEPEFLQETPSIPTPTIQEEIQIQPQEISEQQISSIASNIELPEINFEQKEEIQIQQPSQETFSHSELKTETANITPSTIQEDQKIQKEEILEIKTEEIIEDDRSIEEMISMAQKEVDAIDLLSEDTMEDELSNMLESAILEQVEIPSFMPSSDGFYANDNSVINDTLQNTNHKELQEKNNAAKLNDIFSTPTAISEQLPEVSLMQLDENDLNIQSTPTQANYYNNIQTPQESSALALGIELGSTPQQNISQSILDTNIQKPELNFEPSSIKDDTVMVQTIQVQHQDTLIDINTQTQQINNQQNQILDFKLFLNNFNTTETIDVFLICAYYIKHVVKQDSFSMKYINSKVFQATAKIADMSIVENLVSNNFLQIIDSTEGKKYCITQIGEMYFAQKFQG